MKKLLVAAALCSITLGCTMSSISGAGIQQTADTVTLKGTTALVMATDAYTAATAAATVAVKNGALTDDQLRMLDVLNDQGLALLQGSDKTLTEAQRAASLALLVTQLHSILGK